MSRLNIGHQGLEVETHEKDNVMSSGVQIAFVVSTISVILILFSKILWVNILGASAFTLSILVVFSVYITHNIKSPELLQVKRQQDK